MECLTYPFCWTSSHFVSLLIQGKDIRHLKHISFVEIHHLNTVVIIFHRQFESFISSIFLLKISARHSGFESMVNTCIYMLFWFEQGCALKYNYVNCFCPVLIYLLCEGEHSSVQLFKTVCIYQSTWTNL